MKLDRYEDFPRFADDGRVVQNYMPTYLGRFIKFDDLKAELDRHLSEVDKFPDYNIPGPVKKFIEAIRQITSGSNS